MMRARFTIGDINVILSAVIEGRLAQKVLNGFRLRLKKKQKRKKPANIDFPHLKVFMRGWGRFFFWCNAVSVVPMFSFSRFVYFVIRSTMNALALPKLFYSLANFRFLGDGTENHKTCQLDDGGDAVLMTCPDHSQRLLLYAINFSASSALEK